MMRIAYFYCGKEPHPRRKICLESINADFYKLEHKNPFTSVLKAMFQGIKILFLKKKYDVLFVDNGISLPTIFLLKIFGYRAKSIFYDVETYFAYMAQRSFLMKNYYLTLASCINGFLCVAPLGAEYIKKYFNKPIIVAPGFMWRKVSKTKKIAFNKEFLYVKNYRRDGFHEFLIKSFKKINEKLPNSKLYLIGKDIKENIPTTKNIIALGKINPEPYYVKCTFYLHPGYHDPAPTSILEAMSYGMIPITVKTVGNYYVVEQLSKEFVTEMNVEKFAEAVLKAIKRNDLKTISEKAQKIAQKYTPEKGIKTFKKGLIELLDSIR